MDERKDSAQLRKLAQLYALGELSLQEYRDQRNAIIDTCAGLIAAVPEPEETPVNMVDDEVERLPGDASATRSPLIASMEAQSSVGRVCGFLIIVLALIVGGYSIYSFVL